MRRVLPLVAAITLLSGCANPILLIDAPGYSALRSPAPAAEPRSMSEALQKLNHVRAAYYEAIRSQTGEAQGATTGLVWLGTVIAGLAAGNAHHDAILGTSLIGGTTYGLARTQLDARRIDIWNNGMEALDCAKAAASPLDIGEARRSELDRARQALSDRRAETQLAIDAVNAQLPEFAKAPSDTSRAAQAAVSKSEAALVDADRTQSAAIDLIDASRGTELSVTVDRIHTGVTTAMKEIAIDPRSIKQLVAGVGGFAEIFAPGSGIESIVGNAFGKYSVAKLAADGTKSTSQSDVSTEKLDKAMQALQASTASLASAQKRTTDLLKNVNLAQVNAALKKCGVSSAATALVLAPSALSFTQGTAATKGFTLSGGTPPYVVAPLDVLPDGLSLLFSGGLADSAQVKATASAPAGEFRLQVSDSGTTKRMQQLVVTVDAAESKKDPAPADTSGNKAAAAAPAGVAADWQTLIAAMKAPGFTRQIGPVTFSVAAAELAGATLKVTLKCSKSDAGLAAADVRDRLTSADKAATKRLLDAKALDGKLSQIDLTPSAPCVKG